jgi:hypothetical protein
VSVHRCADGVWSYGNGVYVNLHAMLVHAHWRCSCVASARFLVLVSTMCWVCSLASESIDACIIPLVYVKPSWRYLCTSSSTCTWRRFLRGTTTLHIVCIVYSLHASNDRIVRCPHAISIFMSPFTCSFYSMFRVVMSMSSHFCCMLLTYVFITETDIRCLCLHSMGWKALLPFLHNSGKSNARDRVWHGFTASLGW